MSVFVVDIFRKHFLGFELDAFKATQSCFSASSPLSQFRTFYTEKTAKLGTALLQLAHFFTDVASKL